jgi:hypothetical protein
METGGAPADEGHATDTAQDSALYIAARRLFAAGWLELNAWFKALTVACVSGEAAPHAPGIWFA